MRRRLTLVGFGALCLSVGLIAGSCFDLGGAPTAAERAPQIPETPASAPFDFADLAETVKPAVVNIATARIVEQQQIPGMPGISPDQLPPQFRDLFRFFGLPMPEQPQGQQRRSEPAPRKKKMQAALGSGVIVSADGYVVTNNHVIDGADEIQVVLADDRRLEAEVVGADPKTDLALLRIKEKGEYPWLKFGDSDAARIGEWVLAVGNPFGLNHTFTAGIISAKGRSIGSDLPYQDFLQTDASINPGNSGGPLINLRGEIIGINTAIFSRTGQSAGIGFSIPSNLARYIVDELREHKKVTRGYLGVMIQPVDEQLAEGLGLDEPHGALVTQVYPDSPAAKAGIEVGDVIVAFNGETIHRMQELPVRVSTTPPGTKATVTIIRDGKKKQVQVKLGTLPEGEQDRQQSDSTENETEEPDRDEILGLTLHALTPQEREQVGVEQGLVVDAVDPDSPAAGILHPGDVLLRAGSAVLAAPEDLKAAVKAARKADRGALALLIRRGEQNRFVAVPLEED
ncbi:MAG: DegQ family serine endoprotease [Candidatus Dadabacteria bacterium]|nr:MAG: DegQ family serine endoprotease [Candidatus Dadabacteria bacterium]